MVALPRWIPRAASAFVLWRVRRAVSSRLRRVERRERFEIASLTASASEGADVRPDPVAGEEGVSHETRRGLLSDHVQRFLSECYRAPAIHYGPADTHFEPDRGELVLRGDWKRDLREPMAGAREAWGEDFSRYPPGAACSTLVAAFLGHWTAAGARFVEWWGRSIRKALLEDEFLVDRADWNLGRVRNWTWKKFLDGVQAGTVVLSSPVVALIYRGHVGIILDCDSLDLVDPRNGKRVRGLWVLVADGSLRDTRRMVRKGRRAPKERTVRLFSGKPLVFEPAARRARRERKKKILLVPIKVPTLDAVAGAPRFVVERPARVASPD